MAHMLMIENIKYSDSPYVRLMRKCWARFCASPSLCALFAVSLCLAFAFALFHPCYLTNDEAIMKGLVSGTHFYGAGPAEFTLYTSAILGMGLKTLYTHMPQVNWYDAYLYATLSCAVFFIVRTLAVGMAEKGAGYKALVLAALPMLCGVSFVGLQFTMAAGMITASGLVVFQSLLRAEPNRAAACIAKSAYFVLAVSLGIMIREEAALGVGLLGGLFLMPMLPWRNIKKMFHLFCTGALGAGAALALMLAHHNMIEANPEWKYRKDSNSLYGKLTLHSIFIDSKAWAKIPPDLFDFSDAPDIIWSDSHQKLLLSWAAIGEGDAFSPENMSRVYERVGGDISLSSQRSIGFRLFQPIKSDRLSHHIILLFAVLLIFREKRVWRFSAYLAACFFVVITALSFEYREVPYRVWYAYSVMLLAFLAAYIGSGPAPAPAGEERQGGMLNWRGVLGSVLVLAVILAAYNVFYWQQRHGRAHFKRYQELKHDFARARLDNNDIYLVSGSTLFYATLPFRPNLIEEAGLKKTVILTATLFTRGFQRQLASFGIPEQGTIKNIVERDDVRLLIAPHYWQESFAPPSGTPFPAIAGFMRDNYGLETGMANTLGFNTKCLAAFQISALSEQEAALRQKLRSLARQEGGMLADPENKKIFEWIKFSMLEQYALSYEGEDLAQSIARILSGIETEVLVKAQT